jgi:hypothetical protein
MPSPSEIANLLLTGGTSSSMISPLEAYVAEMAAGAVPYDFCAVRALTKLYQLVPNAPKTMLEACCLLALLHYPSTDFLALSYMISTATKEQVSSLQLMQECAKYLDACQFDKVWTTLELLPHEHHPIVEAYRTQLQAGILRVLALTYKEASLAMVRQVIHGDARDHLSSVGVEAVTDDVVVFCATPENTKRERVFQERVTYATVAEIVRDNWRAQ